LVRYLKQSKLFWSYDSEDQTLKVNYLRLLSVWGVSTF